MKTHYHRNFDIVNGQDGWYRAVHRPTLLYLTASPNLTPEFALAFMSVYSEVIAMIDLYYSNIQNDFIV